MKTLLIHNHPTNDFVKNTLAKEDSVEINFKVKTSDVIGKSFSFDKLLQDPYIDNIKIEQFDVIYIFTQMSESNFIEFEGLRIAHHFRLTDKWKNQKTPIILIGNESKDELCALTDNYHILYTPGVYLASDFSETSIIEQYDLMKSHFRKDEVNRLNENDYKHYLERIDIPAPGHYDSKHSVDNELALLRWSRYIGLTLDNLEKEFGTSLYFKFLNQKKPYLNTHSEQFNLSIEGRVLLIDDKAGGKQNKDGWANFYKKLLGEDTLDYLTILKKEDGQKEIIQKAKNKIKGSENLRVVLLDMRLCDLDFSSKLKQCEYEDEGLKDELGKLQAIENPSQNEQERINEIKDEILNLKDEILELKKQTEEGTPAKTDISRLTGVKILRWINENHPYIQVIVTTASAKAETFNITKSSFGYIQKTIERDIPSSIEHIKTSIESAAPISKQLYQHWKNFEEIRCFVKTGNYITTHRRENHRKTEEILYDVLNFAFNLILVSYQNDKNDFRGYAYLQIFLIIEYLVKDHKFYKVSSRTKETYVILPSKEYLVVKGTEDGMVKAVKYDNHNKISFREINSVTSKFSWDLNNQIAEILLFRFGLDKTDECPWNNNTDWNALKNWRNDISHKKSSITSDQIDKLSKFILYILDPNNIDTTDRQHEALEP